MDYVLVISCFEKASEMDRFYKSIADSDLCCVPKLTLVGTSRLHGLTGEENLKVAQKYKLAHDRIFVCHKNIYMSVFRRVFLDIVQQQYEYVIATEADIWFNQPYLCKDLLYLRTHPNVAVVNALVSQTTPDLNEKMNYVYFQQYPHSIVDGYLNLEINVPWHLVMTATTTLQEFYQRTSHEITDSSYTEFCRKRGQLVLTRDCRASAQHLDRAATMDKYPVFSQLYNHHFKEKRRRVKPQDLEEIQ